MYVVNQSVVHEIQSARMALVLIGIVVVVFWRAVLRILLAIVAIAIVVLVGSGVVILLNGLHG